MVSLKAFRRDYELFDYSLPEIQEHYLEWVKETMYMILSQWNKKKQRYDLFGVKCAKRGNDVYRKRVSSRFKGIVSRAENAVFFNPKDRGVKRTRALWVTLTYDTKRCSFKDGWVNIGVEFNRFMAFTRKKFGTVSCCRVFESFEMGILTSTVFFSSSPHGSTYSGTKKDNSVSIPRGLSLWVGIAT